MNMQNFIRRLGYFVAILPLVPSIVRGGDWPQILGPNRNGVASGERLADAWPAAGPQQLWEQPIGSGYAGAAVAGQNIIVFHRVGDLERLEAKNVDDGQNKWLADFDVNYRCDMNNDSGPRCVPIIAGNRVFAFGAGGSLYCVDFATGKHLWTRDLYDDYRADDGYFGAGSTPIVIGDKVLVNVGGDGGAGVVALDASSGKTVWTATDQKASYSSPVPVSINQQTFVLLLTRLELLLMDPQTGSVHSRIPFGKLGPTVTAALPLVFDDNIFLTASYRIGAVAAHYDKEGFQELWRTDDAISSQYNSCIFHDQHIFGIHGREDAATANLRCIDGTRGTVKWTKSEFGVAHLILADNGILALTADGQIVVFEANAEAYRERQRARAFERATTRALPALAQGRLYVRSNEVQRSRLRAFQVGP